MCAACGALAGVARAPRHSAAGRRGGSGARTGPTRDGPRATGNPGMARTSTRWGGGRAPGVHVDGRRSRRRGRGASPRARRTTRRPRAEARSRVAQLRVHVKSEQMSSGAPPTRDRSRVRRRCRAVDGSVPTGLQPPDPLSPRTRANSSDVVAHSMIQSPTRARRSGSVTPARAAASPSAAPASNFRAA